MSTTKDSQFRCVCTPDMIKEYKRKPPIPTESDIDYTKINDSVSFLEYLRAYQLADILGKYKLF